MQDTPDYVADFARRLRQAMASTGIQGKALADRLKVQQQTVSRWLHGRRYPDTPTRRKLERALNLPAHQLDQDHLDQPPVKPGPAAVRQLPVSPPPGDPYPDFLRRLADLVERGETMDPAEAAQWMDRQRAALTAG